ncbi:reverse transcriptase domain-containing protein [Tanacetum coccineum]
MTGPTFNPTTPNQSPSLQDQILNHISSLETLIKQHNEKAGALITPIRLTFSEEGDSSKGKCKEKGAAEEMDDDLKKPYKEVLKSPFTSCSGGDADISLYEQCQMFGAGQTICRSSALTKMMKRADVFIKSKEAYKNTKFPKGEHLGKGQGTPYKGPRLPRVMQSGGPPKVDGTLDRGNGVYPSCSGGDADISLYEQCQMSGAGQTICRSSAVTEMMKRAYDFIKSEEAYKNTEFPKGEHPEKWQGTPYKGPRLPRVMQSGGPPKVDGYNTYNQRDHYQPPKEILATELQLPPYPPMIETPRKENLDRYCNYHGEKGHYTNDCYQFKRQLEAALESEKLNHLIKDVRQRGAKGYAEGHDEIHDSTSGIPIQHHLGANGDKRAAGLLIHHPCNDEISHPKWNRNIGATESGESSTKEEVMINPACPDQKVTIGTQFSSACRLQLKNLLKDNKDVFAWQPADMVEIDLKIEAVMGFPFKFFLDAYKGYHQIQMSKEDKEKMAFYTNQGTYCYTKMPFGLKNAGATYQRLVDSAFQTQLGRNLEAYVDDMVIKSKTERDMIMDVAETFDNLNKVNMKLNLKKCSFEPTPRRRRQ